MDYRKLILKHFEQNPCEDSSHGVGHSERVYKTAKAIDKESMACDDVLWAASFLHDAVNPPKNSPDRINASKLSANLAEELLASTNFDKNKIENLKHTIEAHSFSRGLEPNTYEAKVIQDADRMEALGAIGIARTFYIAGKMGSQLFNDQDPLANERELNDKKYALDHFKVKLLSLKDTMQTENGKQIAEERTDILLNFLEQINLEI